MRRLLTLLLIVLLPALAWGASSDDDGQGYLTQLLEKNLSGAGRQVHITGFQGALSSKASLKTLTIADDKGVWLTLKDVTLDWSRLALLTGKVEVNELTAAEIDLPRLPESQPAPATPPTAEAQGFSLPSLPVSINIGKIQAQKVVLGKPVLGQEATVKIDGSAQLSGGSGKATINLQRIDGKEGVIHLESSYDKDSKQIGLDLRVKEAAGGIVTTGIGLPDAPALEMSVAGKGPVDDFTANIKLATDNQPRLTGTVKLKGDTGQDGKVTNRFTADIQGDIAPLFAPEYKTFFGNDIKLQVAGAKLPSGQLELTTLHLNAKQIALNGQVDVGADGMPSRINLTGKVASQDGGPVLLPLPGQKTTLDRADISVSYDQSKGDGWQASAVLAGLKQPDLSLDDVTLTGKGRIAKLKPGDKGRGVAGTLTLKGTGIAPKDAALARALGSALGLTTDFSYSPGGPLDLTALDVRGAGASLSGKATLSGLDKAMMVNTTLTLDAQDISRFSGLAGRQLAGAAKATISGTIAALAGTFDLNGDVNGQGLSVGIPQADALLSKHSHVSFSVKRDNTGLTLNSLQVNAQSLQANAEGTLKTGAADIRANLSFGDLGQLGANYGGSMQGRLDFTQQGDAMTVGGSGTVKDLHIADGLFAQAPQVNALMKGTSTFDVSVTRDKTGILVNRLKLNARSLIADIDGTTKDGTRTMQGTLRFADLGNLGPGYSGSVTAQGQVTQTASALDIKVDGSTHDVRLGTGLVPEAQAKMVNSMLQGTGTFDAAVTRDSKGILIRNLKVNARSLSVNAKGSAQGDSRQMTGTIRFGSLADLGAGFRGSIDAQAGLSQTGDTVKVSAKGSAKDLELGQSMADKLLRGTTSFDLAAYRKGKVLGLDKVDVRNPQLSVQATPKEGDPRLMEVKARLANIALVAAGFSGPVETQGTIRDGGTSYAVDLGITGPGAIDAKVKGSLASDFSKADIAANGSLRAELINPLIEPRSIAGPVRFDLALKGPLALGSLSGKVNVSNTRISAPTLGIAATNTRIDTTFANGRARVDGQLTVGGGTIRLSGPISMLPPFTSDVKVTLNNVGLKNPELYSTTANGALSLKGPLTGGASVDGRIRLGKTELRVPSTGLGGSGSIPDGLVQKGASAPVRATLKRAGLEQAPQTQDTGSSPAHPFKLNITVSAPSQVFVRGRGLDAELGGQISITGTSANVVPMGGFDLRRGRLEILGKRLDLSEGSLKLQGKFIPWIHLVATSTNDGVTAMVIVDGDATDPQITFSSTPSLPQEEVLSQLLFGQGLSKISPLQAAQLASAVATLAGKGGEGIVSKLRQNFGLDDLDVQTDSEGQTSVKLGKYLSKKLYSDVSVGDNGGSQVELNYELNKKITVKGKAASDGNTGIGVYFQKDY
ncbi:translocation/assembly module TamB domain-containing protein [Acidimangrovimonas sediminis]|uniref:translocation/assembly module TamB domain-containing protein n=1 Tax=Acidimangrovimonas sediminis TaxID=2056283 RepID=UPI000C80C9E8|nr:translocation/assembly module TamB domain-containing protein [Acidimangrovimonas sediminis]